MESPAFEASFLQLTGRDPFGWQQRLYARFVRNSIPRAVDISTGLGKTSVVPIWLIALADQARIGAVKLPRRLVYVVDRRTVVDQATDVAMQLRGMLRDGKASAVAEGLARLSSDPEKLLAISALRGELADNKEWQEDPARAAIIVGTVDMIGSRLLFSGYGVSRKMRPFHAGLLGQDTLIVHDEAHLSPAFGKLVGGIADLQKDGQESRPIWVMDLSATQRDASDTGEVFSLCESERQHSGVKERLQAKKTLRWLMPGKDEDSAETIANAAASYEAEKARIVVYVRSPKTVAEIAERLKKRNIEAARIATLTGTIRGYERDELVKSPLFAGFRAKPDRDPPKQTQYLIATSAGEVGIDLDADHMVCDLTTLDSMIQRLGRANRLGERAADIVVVDARPEEGDDDEALSDTEKRIAATRKALEALTETHGGRDASPQALRDLVDGMTAEERESCFSKRPTMVELTDILLDGWAMTSTEDLPGRPRVEQWLHGIAGKRPSLYVAWREGMDELVESGDRKALKTLFDKHPILARERLRGNLPDVVEELKKIARRLDRKVVLLPAQGDLAVEELANLVKKDSEDRLREATIVLPPDAGGLDGQGMLDGSAKERASDVADVAPMRDSLNGKDGRESDARARLRVRLEQDETGRWSARLVGEAEDTFFETEEAASLRSAITALRKDRRLKQMAEKARIVLKRDPEGAVTKVLLLMTARGSPDAAEDSQDAPGEVLLSVHNRDVAREAERIGENLGLPDSLREALRLAGQHHDPGKDRAGWQKAIGHPRPYRVAGKSDADDWQPLAKSNQRGFDDSACGRYRHEFGSLREALNSEVIAKHLECDLILHLIAAHHGWARPHFKEDHWDIEEGGYEENPAVAAETPRRFARLQRRFGRWGLAFLESLLRAADYRVSSGRAGGKEKPEKEESTKERAT